MTAASPAAFTAEMQRCGSSRKSSSASAGKSCFGALGFQIATYHFNEGHAAEDTGTEVMVI